MSLLRHVSILLSKLSDCPNTNTLLCYCNYPFLNSVAAVLKYSSPVVKTVFSWLLFPHTLFLVSTLTLDFIFLQSICCDFLCDDVSDYSSFGNGETVPSPCTRRGETSRLVEQIWSQQDPNGRQEPLKWLWHTTCNPVHQLPVNLNQFWWSQSLEKVQNGILDHPIKCAIDRIVHLHLATCSKNCWRHNPVITTLMSSKTTSRIFRLSESAAGCLGPWAAFLSEVELTAATLCQKTVALEILVLMLRSFSFLSPIYAPCQFLLVSTMAASCSHVSLLG